MLIEDYDAACELYDGLRESAKGGAVWNAEVALAWGLVVQTARSCAFDNDFMISPAAARFVVSAHRRRIAFGEKG